VGSRWPGHPSRRDHSTDPQKSSRRVPTTHRLLPRTVQLCIHCRQSPAGFWSAATAARPRAAPGACPAASTWTRPAITSSRSTASTMSHRFTRPLLAAPAALADVIGLTGSRDAWLACAACTSGHHCGLAAPSELALCASDESVTGKDGALPLTGPSLPTGHAAPDTAGA
jgi:hypothetical protein